jgi:hypothetical protein
VSDNGWRKMKFGMKPNHYVIRDYSQLNGSDCLPLGAVLRQLALHGFITALLVAAAFALSW